MTQLVFDNINSRLNDHYKAADHQHRIASGNVVRNPGFRSRFAATLRRTADRIDSKRPFHTEPSQA